VTRCQIRTRYDAVHRKMYVPKGHILTAADKGIAAWLWSRRDATLAGLSAAVMHGAKWIDARLPAEINRRSRDKTDGIVLHSDELFDDEISLVRGIPVTTAARTAFDLGRRYGLTLAVIRLDPLIQATDVKTVDIDVLIDRHGGPRGIVQLREAIGLADAGAAGDAHTPSPNRGGFTTTAHADRRVQSIRDHIGRDMGWDDWKVAVEYGGELGAPPACRGSMSRSPRRPRPSPAWPRSSGTGSSPSTARSRA
jgi:hypothetical protein